jgi:DNA-binding CsgD family transcriptional regulator
MELVDVLIEAAASERADSSSFGAHVLEQCGRAIGFDVGYHARPAWSGPEPVIDASVGLSARRREQMIERGAVYTSELMPVKVAALKNGRGVAIDSVVLGIDQRERCAYFLEVMNPDHGKHALFALGLFRGAIQSVTMMGRTGRAFTDSEVAIAQKIVPILGLAAAAASSLAGPAVVSQLSKNEASLVDYVALGFTNREIALALGISPNTVRNRLSALYTKVGAANRAELIALARS